MYYNKFVVQDPIQKYNYRPGLGRIKNLPNNLCMAPYHKCACGRGVAKSLNLKGHSQTSKGPRAKLHWREGKKKSKNKYDFFSAGYSIYKIGRPALIYCSDTF